MLARQSNDGVRVRLEVEPPRGMALIPAIHREHDEIGAVFEVADDDAALLPGLPPGGREAQCTPAAPVRRGPEESAATEPVERSMNPPSHVHEPPRRDVRRSGCRITHVPTSPPHRLGQRPRQHLASTLQRHAQTVPSPSSSDPATPRDNQGFCDARTDRPLLEQVLDQLHSDEPWSSGNSTASADPWVASWAPTTATPLQRWPPGSHGYPDPGQLSPGSRGWRPPRRRRRRARWLGSTRPGAPRPPRGRSRPPGSTSAPRPVAGR
jgi:hypothetical protein